MSRKKIILVCIVGLCVIGSTVLLVRTPKSNDSKIQPQNEKAGQPIVSNLPPTSAATNASGQRLLKLKTRMSDFSATEASNFFTNFESRYKPAVEKWCKAFDGHVPIDPKDVTPDKFAERVGSNPSFYSEHVFVVDGITLGIEDSKGVARVDYLNAPQQTRKLISLPDGSQSPITTPPIAKEDVSRMLEADGGIRFPAQEIRIIPSSLSGGLNGGAFVNVGGDPNKGGTWNYDMVFGPDGKLAYFLRGGN